MLGQLRCHTKGTIYVLRGPTHSLPHEVVPGRRDRTAEAEPMPGKIIPTSFTLFRSAAGQATFAVLSYAQCRPAVGRQLTACQRLRQILLTSHTTNQHLRAAACRTHDAMILITQRSL